MTVIPLSSVYMYIIVYILMFVYFYVSSQDTVVEIAFIPGKGLFPSSTSLHNGVQRAAGNNYNSGRLKVHIRSPEVSATIAKTSGYPVCTFLNVEAFYHSNRREENQYFKVNKKSQGWVSKTNLRLLYQLIHSRMEDER